MIDHIYIYNSLKHVATLTIYGKMLQTHAMKHDDEKAYEQHTNCLILICDCLHFK